MSERARDLESLGAVRDAQVRAVTEAAAGALGGLLALPDEDERTETYVVKILDVTPGVGKVAGRRLLASLGIDEFSRIRQLSAAERLRIIESCREMR